MKPTPPPRSEANGFSMVELLAVLVLLGIVLAIAAPNMSGMLASTSADGAINHMTSDLMLARMEAIRGGRRVSFIIADGNSYAVVRSGVGGEGADTIRRVSLASEFPGTTLTPASLTLSFDSRGLASSDQGTHEIIARRGTGPERKLTVTIAGTVHRDYDN